MEQTKYIELASQTFDKIQRLFPNLTMTIDRDPEHVELSMDIPKQQGLDFKISLNLQNQDELHISTEDIWCEWFPIESSKASEDYIKAVKGLITGEYRILKFIKNKIVYQSSLQSEKDGKWVTVYREINKFKFPWIKFETQIVQNSRQTGTT